MQQKSWVEIETCQNSSREKERKFDDGHEPCKL
jgi:hypothetical protein